MINPKVDFYFNKADKWHDELEHLRKIVLSCGLTEELKWGVPSYTFEGSNIVLIHVFKSYCALLFFKGVLLKDVDGILIQQTANVQSARQIRFSNAVEVIDRSDMLKAYIFEAIEVERAGLEVTLKKTEEFDVAEEFREKLNQVPALQLAFKGLTPGRQRAYYLYFSAPKQAKTRESRIEKNMPRILAGKGLND